MERRTSPSPPKARNGERPTVPGEALQMSQAETVGAYYRALDGDDYELLADVLTPDFIQQRPDRTFRGRERFVAFMRDERPQTDTRHPIDALYRCDGDSAERVARGRLVGADGDLLVRFVDVFTFTGDRISHLETYTRAAE